jgi:hypothetical protein
VTSASRYRVASARSRSRVAPLWRALLCSCLGGTAIVLSSAPAAVAAAPAVNTFPIPGARVASPGTQIVFRGVPASQLTGISVTGSRSGAHSGVVKGDSDGQGGSFLPAKPFTAGETVTVGTHLNIVGGTNGSYSFHVANPTGDIPYRGLSKATRTRGDIFWFHSTHLQPAAVRLSRRGGWGDIFLAPQAGPVSNGAEIIDRNGHAVWYHPAPRNNSIMDFRVQTYQGKPVLTWWQGNINAGTGRGTDYIYDSSYRQVATVSAGNGLSADLHEFKLTSANTALITAYYPVYVDARSVHYPAKQIVLDSVAQEIDIRTGLVLWQWDSLDHVPLSDTYGPYPKRRTRNPLDYFHINSLDLDHDGNIIISGRNTWAAYKVSHETGKTIWTLGGRRSSFKLGPGALFAFQHDVRIRSGHDWYLTMFDDGGGPPEVHQSRALKLFLDVKHHTARVVSQRQHRPAITAFFEGSVQQLSNLDEFVGWGGPPYFSEYDRNGKLVLDGRFVGANASYRAYRFSWSGTPTQAPAIAASKRGSGTAVWASWNGATSVWSWRVLGGPNATSLGTVGSSRSHGFETQINVSAQKAVQVLALDRAGHVLAHSAVIAPR